jgi:hypothetical protein
LIYITLTYYYISFHFKIIYELNQTQTNAHTQTHQNVTNPTKTTTTTKVARLYRNSLKLVSSWCIDRDIFNDKATEIRGQFDDERGCRPEKAIRLLRVS